MFTYYVWAWQEDKVESWISKLDIRSKMAAFKTVEYSSSYARSTYGLKTQKCKGEIEQYNGRLLKCVLMIRIPQNKVRNKFPPMACVRDIAFVEYNIIYIYVFCFSIYKNISILECFRCSGNSFATSQQVRYKFTATR